MNIHWLVKYYFIAFIGIFSLAYYIENSEPDVNWSLYPGLAEIEVKNIIKNKNCEELKDLYKNEFDSNYKKNSFGFIIRKDKQSKKGLNLLKYLTLVPYHAYLIFYRILFLIFLILLGNLMK